MLCYASAIAVAVDADVSVNVQPFIEACSESFDFAFFAAVVLAPLSPVCVCVRARCALTTFVAKPRSGFVQRASVAVFVCKKRSHCVILAHAQRALPLLLGALEALYVCLALSSLSVALEAGRRCGYSMRICASQRLLLFFA